MHDLVRSVISFFVWKFDYTSGNPKVFSADIGIFVPIGSVTQLCDASKINRIPYILKSTIS